MNKKKLIIITIIEIIAFALLVWLDLWTKTLAVNALKDKPAIPLINGVLEFYYLQNTGAAFSMLQNAQWFFFLVAAVAICGIAYFLWKMPTTKKFTVLRVLLVLIAAGAAGNLVDRVQLSYVRDFIYFSLINFPVFNVADMYVTVSVFLLIVLILFYYKDEDFDWVKKNSKKVEENA